MPLPRILIIDDQLGGIRRDERNRLRENFCLLAGIQDVTGDAQSEIQENPVAEAVFFRGQAVDGKKLYNDISSTISAIRKGWQVWPRWAMIFLDLHFKTGFLGDDGEPVGTDSDRMPSKYFGLTILEHLWRDSEFRDLPIVVLSSMQRNEVEHRFASEKQSIVEFIDKDKLDRDRLRTLIQDQGLIADNRIIGHSVSLLKCLREARNRAKIGNDTILITGETGTGKELFSRYIHDQSPRKNRPFVTVYTQGVPESLVEDRLFGHERGAFTGAMTAMPGAAEDANTGTLFIDEFGDVPASVQSKILRLLDKNIRETQRLGAQEIRRLDLQMVLATNRMQLLSSEDFRQDLLYRIQADDPLVLPPLRERIEDIPLFVEHFVRKYEAEFFKTRGTKIDNITNDIIDKICSHPWPGNVRQLERVIEAAVYRCGIRTLSAAHFKLPEIHKDYRKSLEYSKESSVLIEASNLEPKDLIRMLRETPFDSSAPSTWVGLASELPSAFAQAYANLLKAALLATRKPTLANPGGEIKIHPAVKLMTGDEKITASQAADLIKRIFSMDKEALETLLADPLLSQAYDTAIRLRPKNGRKK